MQGERLPFPEPPAVPHGMTRSQFGTRLIQWGTGYGAAVSRIGQFDPDELRQDGLTREMAQQWRDFYEEVYRLQPTNDSARGRIELMQHIADILGGP